jgi:hypothetical protein
MKIELVYVYILVGLMVCDSGALALPGMAMQVPKPCDQQAHHSALADMIQTVSIIVPEDGKDPRQTYEQHADTYRTPEGEKLTVDEVYDKFLSSGRMYCQQNGVWSGSTASLVQKGDVAVLSAHAFYDKDCHPKTNGSGDFTSCIFQTNPRPPQKSTTYHVKSVQTGTKCPYNDKDKNDWAVVKLDQVVQGAKPFRLRSDCVVKLGWTGMSLSARTKNFKDGHMPSVNPSCTAKDPDPDASNGSFHADCASGGENSGGAMLCDAGRQPPAIGGILIAGNSDPNFDYKRYDRAENFDTIIPISDEIRSAIRAATQ